MLPQTAHEPVEETITSPTAMEHNKKHEPNSYQCSGAGNGCVKTTRTGPDIVKRKGYSRALPSSALENVEDLK